VSPPDRTAPEGGWESLKVDELKEVLEARGLPKSGTKAELVARLEESDAEGGAAPAETEAPAAEAAAPEAAETGPAETEASAAEAAAPEAAEVAPAPEELEAVAAEETSDAGAPAEEAVSEEPAAEAAEAPEGALAEEVVPPAEPAAEAPDEGVAEEVAPSEEPAAEPSAGEVEDADGPEADEDAELDEDEAPEVEAEADEDEADEGETAPAPATRRRGSAETSTGTRRAAPRRPDGDVVVRARSKYVRSAPRKARLVMDHIRGKEVEQARAILVHAPRAVAEDILKLLNSAVANAESNYELGPDELRVRKAFVDEGPTIKRFRPRALGRATRIQKRTSHMTIELTTTGNGR
jgi:ribosomal protein L22